MIGITNKEVPVFASFDGTGISGHPWCDGRFVTNLEVIKHDKRWREDYGLLLNLGVRKTRFTVFMEDVIPYRTLNPSNWRWEKYDAMFGFFKEHGLRVIADVLHHFAAPTWCEGLTDPILPDLVTIFVCELVKRYPEIIGITIANEIYPTAWFCTIAGVWPPHGKDDKAAFVRMIINLSKTVCMASRELVKRFPWIKIMQNESCEIHRVAPASFNPNEEDEAIARFCNERSVLSLDLMSGTFSRETHPLGWYMTPEWGFTPKDEQWFQDNPARIHTLGLDDYCEHQHVYAKGQEVPLEEGLEPLSFSEIVKQRYWRYLNLFPDMQALAMAELNLIANDPTKLAWVRHKLLDVAEGRKNGLPLEYINWHGVSDTALWCSHFQEPYNGTLEGVGWIHICPQTFQRSTGLAYEVMSDYIQGRISAKEIPNYRFEPVVAQKLKGWIKRFLKDEQCVEPPYAYQAYMA